MAELKSRNSNKVYVKDIITILSHAYSRDILSSFKANADELVSRIQRSKRVFFTLEEIKKNVDYPVLDEFLETAFTVWQSATDGLTRLRQLLAIFGDKLLSDASRQEIVANPEKLIFSNAYLALSRVLERLLEATQLFGEVIDVANLRFLFDTEAHKETLSFKRRCQGWAAVDGSARNPCPRLRQCYFPIGKRGRAPFRKDGELTRSV